MEGPGRVQLRRPASGYYHPVPLNGRESISTLHNIAQRRTAELNLNSALNAALEIQRSTSIDSLVEQTTRQLVKYINTPITVKVSLNKLSIRTATELVNTEKQFVEQIGEIANTRLGQIIREKQLEEASCTDPLTGMYNRRFFFEHLKTKFAESNRDAKKCLSVLMIDLDHFKNINDTYGHQAGDLALKEVAETIKRNLRASDVLARYGGEEIVILLPDTEKHGAAIAAEKIRRAIESARIIHEGKTIPVTASIGIGQHNITMESETNLLAEADQNVYRAKENGRNRVEIS